MLVSCPFFDYKCAKEDVDSSSTSPYCSITYDNILCALNPPHICVPSLVCSTQSIRREFGIANRDEESWFLVNLVTFGIRGQFHQTNEQTQEFAYKRKRIRCSSLGPRGIARGTDKSVAVVHPLISILLYVACLLTILPPFSVGVDLAVLVECPNSKGKSIWPNATPYSVYLWLHICVVRVCQLFPFCWEW